MYTIEKEKIYDLAEEIKNIIIMNFVKEGLIKENNESKNSIKENVKENIVSDENIEISVHQKKHVEIGESVIYTLFNPYAMFGYDYEDSIEINRIIDELLGKYGIDNQNKISYTAHVYSE